MFDSLTKLFEGKNINQNMTLRNQLKNVTIQNADKGLSNKLEAVEEEVENSKIVMTTLNGLPRSWDFFIQRICARRKLITFNRLWEE